MRQTPDAITQNWAERLCWEVARRDDTRIARRLGRKQGVAGIYRLDEEAVLDDRPARSGVQPSTGRCTRLR
jgi:hypothetical protein